MSYSEELKAELLSKVPGAGHCVLAELAGMMCCGGAVECGEDGTVSLVFSTEKENIAKKCFTFLKKSFNMNIVVGKHSAVSRRNTCYSVRVNGEREVFRCTEEMGFALRGVWNRAERMPLAEVPCSLPEKPCCVRSFVRGAFLMGGAMNDPNKSYHYEIAVPSASVGDLLMQALARFDCEPKLWERRGSTAVYLKDAAQIADALTVMDATAARVRFEDIRVVRNKRGEIQRKVNCEVSNLAKTSRAASRQLEAIGLIEQTVGLSALPEELQETARLRREHPDASLQELGEYANPPVGRSGVNHRLQKLLGIAEGLRFKEGG